MTIRYVGPGGNDGNSGLTWALRKLTLNGVEDTPVVAGDVIYVGPGTYRELLTADVAGGIATRITYIGDYTGANTDGIGGIVRITGSNDDITATRANCIYNFAKSYRTYSGFICDLTTAAAIDIGASNNAIVEDCFITNAVSGISMGFIEWGGQDCIVRLCVILGMSYNGVVQTNSALQAGDPNNLVENTIIIGGSNYCASIVCVDGGGLDVRNCLLMMTYRGIYLTAAAVAACNVTNSIIIDMIEGLSSQAVGTIVENYNSLWGNATDRVNTNVGAQSNTYPPLFNPLWFMEMVVGKGRLLSVFDLASYSQIINVAGIAPPATDMRGTGTIGAQREWGSLEYDPTLVYKPNAASRTIVGQSVTRTTVW